MTLVRMCDSSRANKFDAVHGRVVAAGAPVLVHLLPEASESLTKRTELEKNRQDCKVDIKLVPSCFSLSLSLRISLLHSALGVPVSTYSPGI